MNVQLSLPSKSIPVYLQSFNVTGPDVLCASISGCVYLSSDEGIETTDDLPVKHLTVSTATLNQAPPSEGSRKSHENDKDPGEESE